MDFLEELLQTFETLYGEENTSSGFEEMGTGEEHTALPPAVPAPAAAPTPPLPPDTSAPPAPSAPPVTPAPAAPLTPLLPPISPSPPFCSLSTDTIVTYVTLLSPIMSVIPIHTHPPVTPVTPVTPVPAVPQAAAQAKPPYVKKPPNAFMLFRKEQRPNVVAQHRVRDCATVNKILGEMWNSLAAEDKERYFVLSRMESKRHYELHPGWTPSNKKRKRS